MTTATRTKSRPIGLSVSMALSITMLLIAMVVFKSLGTDEIVHRLVVPLLRLMVFITIGLAAGQIIEAVGWTARLGRLGAPLFRFARLGDCCSAAFSTAFVSGTAANAMLHQFRQDGKISRQQLILTHLANQVPAFFLHLPTTVFIVLPLTGWAGGLYFILTFIAAMVRFVLVLAWSRWRLGSSADQWDVEDDAYRLRKDKTSVLRAIGKKLPRRMVSVATYVVPIYIAVFLFNSAGLFDWTRSWLTTWVAVNVVPVDALSLVVLGFAAEFTSGFAAAGALLQQGLVTPQQAVLALLTGNVVAFPIRALRHQLPRLMGIFTPKLGLQLLLYGQGFRITSLICVGVIYYLVG